MNVSAIDTGILGAYLLLVLGMSFWFARRQKTGDDYFLAGRRIGGSTLAMSIVANQVSAVSLIGAPAFVALREGGGLRWLQYELAVPLAMLVLMATLLPALRSVSGSSIYEFIERRFGRMTRKVLAALFLISRGLALGVILYASAVVVSLVLNCSVDTAILLIGIFSVVYTSLGGIVADIWSDVLQLAILWVGIIASVIYLAIRLGPAVITALPEEKIRPLVFDAAGLTNADNFAFWPMLFGGIFLYLSYYGCDQSQAQRLLTARDDVSARRALLLNGLIRFPLVLTYCALGLLLAGLLDHDPSFAAAMNGRPADSLVPVFILNYLPAGLRGLLLAAILAAAMSSIDSALNSLAAVTLEDIAGLPPSSQPVQLSRLTSLAWGIFAVAAGLVFARSGTGILELINQIGSAFYGPVLAVFMLGVSGASLRQAAVIAGVAGGLGVNLSLAQFAPYVSWLWWNPIGFFATLLMCVAISKTELKLPQWAAPRREAAILTVAFLFILTFLFVLNTY